MQMLSERRPTVHVYRCPPFDHVQLGGEPNASQSTLRFAHTTVDALIGQALLQRYERAPSSTAADLEYVPLVCFGRGKGIESRSNSRRPIIGRFTILATAWTLGEGIRLRLRKRMCIGGGTAGSQHGVPMDELPFAILSTEAPGWWPIWPGNTSSAALHPQLTPPPGRAATQVLQIPYPTTSSSPGDVEEIDGYEAGDDVVAPVAFEL